MKATISIDWRQVAVYTAVVIMEVCWLYALLSVINNASVDGRISVFGVLAVFPVAVIFHKLLRSVRLHKILLSMVSWIAWLAGMLLLVKFQLYAETAWLQVDWLLAVPRAIGNVIYTFSPELLLLLSSAVTWWLGGNLANKGVRFDHTVTRFQFGLIMLLLALYISYVVDVSVEHSVPVALVFFLCGLSGISLAHTRENTGWSASRLYRGRWSVLLMAAIILVLLLGLLIGLVISADLLQVIVAAVKWVWAWIMHAILFLISLIPMPDGGDLPPPEMVPPQMEAPEHVQLWRIPDSVRAVMRIIWAVVFIGIIVIALWRMSSMILQWMRRRLSNINGEEIEPLQGAFKEDLINLFRFIGRKIRNLLQILSMRRPGAAAAENITIRQMYRQFLRWAGSHGYPRHSAQTPYDFLTVMKEAVPEHQPELLLLTQHYVSARYGRSIPADEDIQQLTYNWHRMKKYKLKKPEEEQPELQGESENGQSK
jgi:hypothetical protein